MTFMPSGFLHNDVFEREDMMSRRKTRKRLDNFLLIAEQGDTEECIVRLESLLKRSPDYRYQSLPFEEFLTMGNTEEFDGIVFVFEGGVSEEMTQRIRVIMKDRLRPLFLAFVAGLDNLEGTTFEVPEVLMKKCQCNDRVGFCWRGNAVLERILIKLWVDFAHLRNEYFRSHSVIQN